MERQDRSFGRLIFLISIIIGGLYLLLAGPFLNMRSKAMDEKLARDALELKHFVKSKSLLPSLENYERLRKETELLQGQNIELANFVGVASTYLPKGVNEAGLYFIERLHSVRKKLSAKASELKVELPPDFGFGEELPDAALVTFCLRQLDVMDKVVSSLIENKATSITLIKPLKFEGLDAKEGGQYYKSVDMQFSVKCSAQVLIRFLTDMANSQPIIIVKNLQVVSDSLGALKVDMVASGVLVD